MSDQITCGCTCHEIDANDPNNVVIDGQKWHCICALQENVRLLGKTKEELKKLQAKIDRLQGVECNYKLLKANVESLICPNCFKPVEEKWVFFNGHFCCTDCASDIFPAYF